MLDWLVKNWPQGITAVGLGVVAIGLFRYIWQPWSDRVDARTKAKRDAAREIAERQQAAEQAQLDARVRIAEAQKEMVMMMSETTKMALASHERCHQREEALRTA
jgi:hypothetical protein